MCTATYWAAFSGMPQTASMKFSADQTFMSRSNPVKRERDFVVVLAGFDVELVARGLKRKRFSTPHASE